MGSSDFVPEHLKPFVFEQHYELYTYEEHSIWRYVMRQLRHFFKDHAHHSYLEGLEKTGISIDSIPRIEDMDQKLSKIGWRAIAVSGFIPPMAFMEFQSLGILPIAREVRQLEHILYTPAPDIIHEAAGHAPMLINPDFSHYLKSYGEVAIKSIFSKEDLDYYLAVRNLSDIKERTQSSDKEIQKAEEHLKTVEKSQRYLSEANLLSRMNWWTAEYGLLGEPAKIFGAGLLSSVEESQNVFSESVKKIPLTLDCINYGYDITKPQPQLFVTPDFKHLTSVLEEMAKTMAYRLGKTEGLKKALRSQTVNTVELDSGLQISGKLDDVKFLENNNTPFFLKFEGPTQLSYKSQQLPHHGPDFHEHGFSTPLGDFTGELKLQSPTKLEYASGMKVQGVLKKIIEKDSKPLIATFENAQVTYKNETLFQPDWGVFDLCLSSTHVPSVFSGFADRLRALKYSFKEFFEPIEIQTKKEHSKRNYKEELFQQIRKLREHDFCPTEFEKIKELYFDTQQDHWLIALEIYEVATKNNKLEKTKDLLAHIEDLKKNPDLRPLIQRGINLIYA